MKFYYYKDLDKGDRFFIEAETESEAHDKVTELYDCVQFLGEETEESARSIGWPIIK